MAAQYGVTAAVPITSSQPAMRHVTPAALPSGTTNNYAPADASTGLPFYEAQVIRQATNAAGSTITGLDASRCRPGQLAIFENVGPTGPLMFSDDSGSTVAYRFDLPNPTAALPVGCSAMFLYDPVNLRWKLINQSSIDQVVSVTSYGALGDGATDDTAAILSALTAAAASGGTLFFPNGTYVVNSIITIDSKSNFRVCASRGALIKKSATFPVDTPIFNFRYCTNIVLDGLRLQGATSSTTDTNFGDDGVIVASCTNTLVRGCYFKNFGDSALRVRSYTFGTVPPTTVDHSTSIVTENTFENCQQTSTTPGGTESIIFSKNIGISLKGSFKFASRLGGAGSLIVTDNIVRSSLSVGIEVSSYSNVVVANNVINSCSGIGIHVYTNTSNDVSPSFPWKNVKISGNTISNSLTGIRVSNDAYNDGTYYLADGVEISNNTIDTTTGSSSAGGILLVNGPFRGSRIAGNLIRSSACYGIYIQPVGLTSLSDVDDIVIDGNTIESATAIGLYVLKKTSGSTRVLKQVFVRNNVVNNAAGLAFTEIDQLQVNDNYAILTAQIICTTLTNAQFRRNYFKSSSFGFNLDAATATVEGNYLEGATTYGFRTAATCSNINELDNTIVGGTAFNIAPIGERSIGAKKWRIGTAAPVAGAFVVGDIVYNSAPTVGSAIGWRCVTAGSPGTWEAMQYVDLTSVQSIAGAKTFSSALAASTSIAIGGGTALTKVVVYTPSLTPAATAANTTAEQTFAVTGLTTADTVHINPPASMPDGLGIVGVRVSAADTLAIRFSNNTAGNLTPIAGAYRVVAVRS